MAKAILLPVTDRELTQLIREAEGKPVDIAFGTGGAAVQWDGQGEMPWYIERLGYLRGVLNENCDGAGI